MRMLQTSMGIGPKLLRRTLHWIGALCRGARRRVRTSASRSAPSSERVDRRYRLLAAQRAPSVFFGTTTLVSELAVLSFHTKSKEPPRRGSCAWYSWMRVPLIKAPDTHVWPGPLARSPTLCRSWRVRTAAQLPAS